jgi:large subunit ribosomal protein L22
MNREVHAQLNYLRMGPRKVRLVADLMRGRKVKTAINTLSVLNKLAAKPLLKLLNSAIANAKHNFSLAEETLRVKQITVDGGPVLKRWMPRAHGRATPIRERTSHIEIVLVGSSAVDKKKEELKVKSEEKK